MNIIEVALSDIIPYVYPIDKRMRKRLLILSEPYPKTTGE